MDVLRASGADVTFRVYEAGHEITPQAVAEVKDFLLKHEPLR